MFDRSILLLAALAAVALADDPLTVREVSQREEGVFFRIGGPGASALRPGLEGSFAEEVRLGEAVYRRTLARFVIATVDNGEAWARITARVEGFRPLIGSLVATGPVELPAPPEGVATLSLDPFEVVRAEGGRLVVGVDLQVRQGLEVAVADAIDRQRDRVRGLVFRTLLALSARDLEAPDVREQTAIRIRQALDGILPRDPVDPEAGTLRAVVFREWRVE